jgi:hypothetical protein
MLYFRKIFVKWRFRYLKLIFGTLSNKNFANVLYLQNITLDLLEDDFKFTKNAPEVMRTIILLCPIVLQLSVILNLCSVPSEHQLLILR